MSEATDPPRTCGDCSLCCTVLRVDPLRKLGGIDCVHQQPSAPCCQIHPKRPPICRAYSCLWLGGALDEEDRPDKLGAVLDIVSSGPTTQLEIREATPGAFARNERLQEIAVEYRASMAVRISDVDDVLDPDRPFRLLLPGGIEHAVTGEWTEVTWPGGDREQKRLPLIERTVRKGILALHRWRVRGYRGAV